MFSTCATINQELRRRWTSVLHHIRGVHRWEDDGNEHRCYHDDLSADEQRIKKWLPHDSPAYKALYEVVMDTRLLNDLNQMTLFKHTGMKRILEWFSIMKPWQSWKDHVLINYILQCFLISVYFDSALPGQLEVFHNSLLKYCPKRLHFAYPSMQARTMLAVMDHNENHDQPRQQATTETGKDQN